MAYSPNDLFSALQALHPSVDLSNYGFMQDAQTAAAQGMDPGTFTAQYAQDPGIAQAYSDYFQNLANPSISNLQEQSANANNMWQQQNQATNLSFNNNDASIRNNADQAGLGTSGVTTTGLSYNDANRANSLAQLALQNSDTQAGIQANIASTQQQVGVQASNAELQDTQTYNTNQQNALNSLQNINVSLLASDPTYANSISTMAARAGLGILDPTSLSQWASTQVKNSTGATTASTSTASSGGTGTSNTSGSGGTTTQTSPGWDVTTAQKAGVSQSMYNSAANILTNIFQNGNWKGQDLSKTGFTGSAAYKLLQSALGTVNPTQASYLYYRIRKAVIGQ